MITSQCYRLRRIINDDERLKIQLNELKCDFLKCQYPEKLVNDIIKKVEVSERILTPKERPEREMEKEKVIAITTHGRDAPLTNILKKIERNTSVDFKNVKKRLPHIFKTCL